VVGDVVFAPRLQRDRTERSRPGRRARSLASHRKGKYSRHRLAPRHSTDVALDATLRAAAVRGGAPLQVEAVDLRRKVREHRSPFAVCFVVDNSWSVHAERMVEKAKGIVFRLLEDATGRGDKVALVAFRGGVAEATVALPFTSSLAAATRRLRRIPLAGQTPLADALRRARTLLRQELSKHPNAVPLVVCVTDGEATIPLRHGSDPSADAVSEGQSLRRARIGLVVADTSDGARGCAARLARAAGGIRIPVTDLASELLLELAENAASSTRRPPNISITGTVPRTWPGGTRP
jgi:magnesium chelatase subunit D